MALRNIGPADEERVLTPSGGYTPNQIVKAPSGRIGWVMSQVALLEGEPAVIKTSGHVGLTAGSSATWDEGETVNVNLTTQAAVTTAANGTTILTAGIAVADKVNGQVEVEINLNDQGPTPESLTA